MGELADTWFARRKKLETIVSAAGKRPMQIASAKIPVRNYSGDVAVRRARGVGGCTDSGRLAQLRRA